MILKYIIIKQEEEFIPIIFSKSIVHSNILPKHSAPVSAGFCFITNKGNSLKVVCFGNSTSLKINSKPDTDQLIIKEILFPTLPDKIAV